MKEVTCLCGWQCRGTEDEVVEQVQVHGREEHGIESTREEILAIAVDVPFGGPHEDGSIS
jgi:predicted small metal-binding protein